MIIDTPFDAHIDSWITCFRHPGRLKVEDGDWAWMSVCLQYIFQSSRDCAWLSISVFPCELWANLQWLPNGLLLKPGDLVIHGSKRLCSSMEPKARRWMEAVCWLLAHLSHERLRGTQACGKALLELATSGNIRCPKKSRLCSILIIWWNVT